MSPSRRARLDCLDALSPWAFTSSLYLLRWLIMLPFLFASGLPRSGKVHVNGETLLIELFGVVLLDPLVETLTECSLPFWLMRKMKLVPAGERPWAFIMTSAVIMTVLHLGAWPEAIVPAMITGTFLAYVYGHFAAERTGRAILHVWAFHSGINIVGWTLLALS